MTDKISFSKQHNSRKKAIGDKSAEVSRWLDKGLLNGVRSMTFYTLCNPTSQVWLPTAQLSHNHLKELEIHAQK